MQLNPRLAKQLETYEPDRLRAILFWFNADAQTLQSQSQSLSAIMEDMQDTMSIEQWYDIASRLELDDMVRVSILNEFGPNFERRGSFRWLSRNVSHRFTPQPV